MREFECGLPTTNIEGSRIRIAGYVHPLEFGFSKVKSFLLAPPLGPCRHPSPPPANQLILVHYQDGHNVTADPIFVSGVIEVETVNNGIAVSRWRLTADQIEPALIPDVIAD